MLILGSPRFVSRQAIPFTEGQKFPAKHGQDGWNRQSSEVQMPLILLLFFTFLGNSVGRTQMFAETVAMPQTIKFEVGTPPDSAMLSPIVDVYTKAFADIGYKFEVKHYPSERGLHLLKNKSVDGTLGRLTGLNKLAGFENLRVLGEPIVFLDVTLFCRATPDSIMAKDGSKKLLLATRRGNMLASRFAKNVVLRGVPGVGSTAVYR